jgi:hypothetical protein
LTIFSINMTNGCIRSNNSFQTFVHHPITPSSL